MIYSEGLSSLMRLVMGDGLLKGAKASRGGAQILHLIFVDDYILFSEANVNGA